MGSPKEKKKDECFSKVLVSTLASIQVVWENTWTGTQS